MLGWFVFILAVGYFGYNMSEIWAESKAGGVSTGRAIALLLFGVFIAIFDNLKMVFR
ncbi:MAG: hypothetical protein WDA47_03250 [Bacilli bacterium]|jgi:hypothetical protein